MDEFWTETENAFRASAAGAFRDLDRPDDAGAGDVLDGLGRAAGASLSAWIALLDETARRHPRLGELAQAGLPSSVIIGPAERTACVLGRLAGTAAFVFAAGTRAAQERGYFSSILMDFRLAQERLAGLVSGAELARLGACRLCRLLERGDRDRAGHESEALRARAEALDAEVRSVAAFLLGPAWTEALAPPGGFPAADERIP